jgi:hypothetical protein
VGGGLEGGSLPGGTGCTTIGTHGTARVLYGCYTKLYTATSSTSPGTATDITPAAFPGAGAAGWAFDAFGSDVLAAPVGGTLYRWTGAGVAAAVAVAPANMYDMLVTSERQVMALGTNEVVSGTLNRMCIRVSNLEDYTSAGSWTPTSTNNADEIILEGSGFIVAGRRVGAYIAVWTNAALHIGQYIGDPGQSYRFDIVDQIPGPTSREAVCVIDGTAYWMGTDLRLHVWSPGALPSVIPCPISRDLQDQLRRSRARGRPHGGYSGLWRNLVLLQRCEGRRNRLAFPLRRLFAEGIGRRTASGLVPRIDGSDSRLRLSGHQRAEPESIYMARERVVPLAGQCAGRGGKPGSLAPTITLGDMYLDNAGRRAMVRRFIP